MEKLVIVEKQFREDLEKSKRKGEIRKWSDVMREFNITSDELKELIESGNEFIYHNVPYYFDEALIH